MNTPDSGEVLLAIQMGGSLPEGPISPFEIAGASYLYESMTGYAASLEQLRTDDCGGGDLDLGREEHRRALVRFLNSWGCRNLAEKWHKDARAELGAWFQGARERLDTFGDAASLSDMAQQRKLADVFDDLATQVASWRKSRGRKVRVSFGPTATAKTLFVLRPSIFPAWDRRIRETCGYGFDGASYAGFARDVQLKIAESRPPRQQGDFAEGELVEDATTEDSSVVHAERPCHPRLRPTSTRTLLQFEATLFNIWCEVLIAIRAIQTSSATWGAA